MDIYGQICKYVDDHKMDIAATLSEMVQIDSQNNGAYEPGNESKVQAYVTEKLRELDMDPQSCAFDPEKSRPNVYGRMKGEESDKTLLFLAHADTVKVTEPEQWTHPPLGGVIADGCVHGRGAADDKNGIAAMLWAAKALKECGIKPKGDVYLMTSVGEETCEGDRHGAGPAAASLPTKPDFAVVCEATHLALETASSNLTFFEVTVQGKSAHMCARNQAMFPQPYGVACGNEFAVDAFYKAMPIIEALYRLERDWSLNMRHPVWGSGGRGASRDTSGVGCNIINLAKIQGGDYELSVMDSVTLTYGILFSPYYSLEKAKEEILKCIEAVASTDSWLRANPPIVKMPVITEFPAYDTPLDNHGVQALTRALKKACGIDAVYSGQRATTDASWVSEIGIPAVTVGPGGADNGPHSCNEYLPIDELCEAVKFYAATVLEFFDEEE